jgi:hypothetical protein
MPEPRPKQLAPGTKESEMDLSQLLRALGLQQAYQSYQENIGQPFANIAGPFGRGLLGLDRPEYGEEQAYRTGQALGNMPGLNAPAGLLKAATQAPEVLKAAQALPELAGLLGATVFHGSPYAFKRFDPTKIGSGEGAQAYGYGHYVAELPMVADEYRLMLSPHKITGEAAQDLANYSLRMKPTIEEAVKYLEKEKKTAINQSKISSNEFATDKYIKQYDDAISLLQSNKVEKPGYLYTIDLPDEQIAKMLDWDKPLSQQPKEVQDFLSKISFNPPNKNQLIGEWLKPRLSEGMSPYWSEDLRKAGIPGIRYLDQGSRGTGKGTSNFVVFPGNEGLLKILERNSQPIVD